MSQATFERKRGDTWTLNFTINPSLDGTTWIASDFSTIRFTIRKDLPKSTVVTDVAPGVLLQASLAGGEIVAVDSTHLRVTVQASSSTSLPTGSFPWDIQVTVDSPSPQRVYTTAEGTFRITADVTRATA